MFNPKLLGRADNRLEDFTANVQGELSERQLERLRGISAPVSSREFECETHIAEAKSKGRTALIVALMFLAIMVLFFFETRGDGRQTQVIWFGLIVVVFGGNFLYRLITGLHYHQELNQLRAYRAQMDAGLQSSLDAPDVESYLQRVDGTVVLEQGSGERRNQLHIGNLSFEVAGDLWQQFRDTGGQVIAHYLETRYHGNLLLSIQSASAIEQTQLSEVVGISDDGEIIYETDLTDDVPDGEVRPLKKNMED